MAVHVSNYVLETWGLKALPTAQRLAATFHSLHVYEVRGFTFETSTILGPIAGTVHGFPYALCVGDSVNAICHALVGQEYADSEEKWRVDHKAAPPYLVIHMGPTARHEATITHAKEEGRAITTYSKFLLAKAELKEIEGKVLSPLLSGLTCSFSLHEPPAHLVPTDSRAFGITDDNRTVDDFSLNVSAQLTLASKLSSVKIEERVSAGIALADAMNVQVARFFHLALSEEDPLKRFLYFFLAIENKIHTTFKAINHTKNISQFVSAPARVAASTEALFNAHKHWTNLRDRFIWCTICIWTHLDEADIKEFETLKEVRDKIAHGSLASPPHFSVLQVQKLATKLQLT
jgi:hypothetical protein